MPRPAPLGLPIPILQAPTGSIAGPELAAAVSRAGGMGSMGLTWTEPEAAREAVTWVRRETPAPFAVNFALAFPPRALPAALEAGAPAAFFSWGDPTPHLPLVRSFGAHLGVQVTNEEEARRALDLGADLLIAQGIEAGGHVQSTARLAELLPRLVAEAGTVPVVAAGGIADGAGIARALSLGAAGAMLGTRFVATRESRAHPLYKRRLTEAPSNDALLTTCFDGGWPGAPHRALRNPTLDTWQAAGSPSPGARPGEGDVVAHAASGEPILRYEDAAPREGMTGDVLEMCLYAGTAVGLVRDVPPAADLLARLWRECLAALERGLI